MRTKWLRSGWSGMRWYWVLLGWFALGPGAAFGLGQVLISELMYRPASEDTREEYIELYNAGATAVDLTGWRFTTGVRFTFPAVSLPAGEYLAVAADLDNFRTNHPTVTNFVGGWDGILSNSGQLLELVDARGDRVNAIRYADEGDWARRELGPIDAGHRGWGWASAADGGGRSIELIQPALPNVYGQNWAASEVSGGTPGQPNSVARANVAPFILEAAHFPLVPKATDPVAVTARVLDEAGTGLTVRVHYRVDEAPEYETAPMWDDGEHGDGAAADGVYGAWLPPAPKDTVVEFYFEAEDGVGQGRTYPAPAWRDGEPAQAANLLYQVDDALYAGTLPIHRLVLKGADLAELRQINERNPPAPYATSDQSRSHAQMNATFISVDGQGSELRYLADVRNRGNGSRTRSPQSYRVSFRSDQLWKRVSAINLNTQYTHAQLLGSAWYRRAGLPAGSARPVQVRVNNANLATSGSPSYGLYVCAEVLNSEFAARTYPRDSSGNMYRGIRLRAPGADLHYEGEDAAPYRENYFKRTNTSEDDWSDLIELTRVLDEAAEVEYAAAVRRVVDVEAWMLYFALETLADNKETNLANGNNGDGEGDDFFLYRGVLDPRFRVLPYDLDTIFNQGDTRGRVEDSLFRMAANPVLDRLVKHPEFAPVYYATLVRLLETVGAPDTFEPLVDQTLRGLVPETVLESIKDFAGLRRAWVASQIPRGLAIQPGLTLVSGYPYTTNAQVTLTGMADVVETRAVRVNGQPAAWSAWEGTWTAADVALWPGINRVLVQSFDVAGRERERASADVWRDTGASTEVSGPLAEDTTWSAPQGPYYVTSPLTVPAGRTLTLEPGVTVFLAAGANLTVNGRLAALGTDGRRIRFATLPGSGGAWGGVLVAGATAQGWFGNVDFSGAGMGGYNVRVDDGTLLLEQCTFADTTAQYVDLRAASFHIRHCVFPTLLDEELIHGSGLPAAGYGIVEGCWFGETSGYNDTIDFTGGQRPGAILQVHDNVFTRTGDDFLDLDGTDAHVEGNVFLKTVQTVSPVDTSAAISGGKSGSRTSRITIVRNLFYDSEHMAMAKEGNFYLLENNTAVGLPKAGFLLDEPGRRSDGVTPAQGGVFRGNILWHTPTNFLAAYVNDPEWGTLDLTSEGNVLSGPDAAVRSTNDWRVDPRLVLTNQVTWQNIREAYRLRPGSPAQGTGPNGIDRGALVPAGASVAGEPPPTTWRTNALLTVAGPGVTHYRYSVWTAAPPVTPGAPVTEFARTALSEEQPVSVPLAIEGLTNGVYRVEVIGKNSAGVWQVSSLAPPGEAEAPVGQPQPVPATLSAVWTVDTGYRALRLNELLAKNDQAVLHGEDYPDLVELYNDSPVAHDLSGLGLTTAPDRPHRFTFPPGTILAAEGYLVVYADADLAAPGLHLGFALNQSGEGLYLFDRADRGGALLDAVVFGRQLPDLSVGRVGRAGQWALTRPTFGAANVSQPTGEASRLRLNEWLASTRAVFRDDFVELYNSDTLPVSLGGLYLTDNPIGDPAQHRIAPLSYIAPGGFALFQADGRPDRGADHLGFSLAAEEGLLALLGPELEAIDWVVYGPQRPDVSQGRTPNGGLQFALFSQPTPGGVNPGTIGGGGTSTSTFELVSMTNSWNYWQTGDPGAGWSSAAFDDGAWPAGPALLYVESSSLPAPKNTPLDLGQITYYFRTRFDFPTNTAGVKLAARAVVDDGVVLYLNGVEVWRLGLPSGEITDSTRASRTVGNATYEGPVDLPTEALRRGENLLAAEVHQTSSGSSDIVFGLALEASLTRTNFNLETIPVLLNEVLAGNATLTNRAGATPDWVELFNPSPDPVDLDDCSLTDDLASPRRWVFPAGTVLPAGGWLVIECDRRQPVSAANTGFGLNAQGGGVYLFDRLAAGGGLLDSLNYGLQASDFAIGRTPDGFGSWGLVLPTPGAANLEAALGDVAAVRVNEWMASPATGEDWFELYNPNAQPVALGGLFLTDDLNRRNQFEIRPLSFLATGPRGLVRFWADGAPESGADHVGFKLAAAGESIGLFSADGIRIDGVTFGAQQAGVSEGRLPDGGSGPVVRFPVTATPGASNYLPLEGVAINEVLTHAQPPLERAIELHNPTNDDQPVGGWFLSDSPANFQKYRLPAEAAVPAHGFLVVYESEWETGPGALAPLALDPYRSGEVWLAAADLAGRLTGRRAHAAFDAAALGTSMGRVPTSAGADFVALSRQTFGRDWPATVEEFRTGRGAPNASPHLGPVVLNELMFHPPSGAGSGGADNIVDEFLELRNVTADAVLLYDPTSPTNTWRLRGGLSFDFPGNLTLARGGCLLLVNFSPGANPGQLTDFRSRYAVPDGVTILGPYAGKLGDADDTIELLQPGPPLPASGEVPYLLVERVRYTNRAPWPAGASGTGRSLQRRAGSAYGNEPTNWRVADPTAGRDNDGSTGSEDRDADGLWDDWELLYFGSLDRPEGAPAADPDRDGLTNLQEQAAGTHPLDWASGLRILSAGFDGGRFGLLFRTAPSRSYLIQYRDSLTDGVWRNLVELPIQAATDEVRVTDPTAGVARARYYRVVTSGAP